jgi:hypothetical protein
MIITKNIKKIFSPITLLFLAAVLFKIVSLNLSNHKKSFYQNYDPEKIALYASSADKQEIEIPPSKNFSNGHTNNNNEFKFKCVGLEQASIDLFKNRHIVLDYNFKSRSNLLNAIPIFLSNRSILI